MWLKFRPNLNAIALNMWPKFRPSLGDHLGLDICHMTYVLTYVPRKLYRCHVV
jgi:hypothetical protein